MLAAKHPACLLPCAWCPYSALRLPIHIPNKALSNVNCKPVIAAAGEEGEDAAMEAVDDSDDAEMCATGSRHQRLLAPVLSLCHALPPSLPHLALLVARCASPSAVRQRCYCTRAAVPKLSPTIVVCAPYRRADANDDEAEASGEAGTSAAAARSKGERVTQHADWPLILCHLDHLQGSPALERCV